MVSEFISLFRHYFCRCKWFYRISCQRLFFLWSFKRLRYFYLWNKLCLLNWNLIFFNLGKVKFKIEFFFLFVILIDLFTLIFLLNFSFFFLNFFRCDKKLLGLLLIIYLRRFKLTKIENITKSWWLEFNLRKLFNKRQTHIEIWRVIFLQNLFERIKWL